MRILHVITSLHTGGAEMMAVNMLTRLSLDGHDVGMALFNGQRTNLYDKLQEECPSCKIYPLGTSYYNPLYIVKLINIMRQYDVVHTHNSSPQLFAAIANVFANRRLITTEHSTNNRKRERGGILRMLDKWMYPRYHKIVCISKIAEDRLKQFLLGNNRQLSEILAQRIITINNGVDVEYFYTAAPIQALQKIRFTVVMVAGFREAKDQDTLIRAISLLPKDKYELWLVGDGERRVILEQLTKELNMFDNVCFFGVRSNVANILKSSDCVVMSSHWEGLSLSNIEGMAAGKPFVASDVDGLREVTDGYGILFPHENAEALAEIIRHLHDDKEYYDEVADKCYQRARQFDISTMVKRYLEVYSEIK